MSDVSKFSVYGKMTAQAGQRGELIERFKDALRDGPAGLESFSISVVLDDPDSMWLTQIWTDKAAHDTWTRSEASVSATKHVVSLLAEPPVGSHGQIGYLYEGPTA